MYTEAVDRVSFASDSDTWELTPAQQKALEEVQEQFAQKNTVLLQGVAASGKTLLYSQLIEQTLAQGKKMSSTWSRSRPQRTADEPLWNISSGTK